MGTNAFDPSDARVAQEHLGMLSDLVSTLRVKSERGDEESLIELEALTDELRLLYQDFRPLPKEEDDTGSSQAA